MPAETLQATVYRKGRRRCIFVPEGDHVRGVLSAGNGRVVRFTSWTWQQALAHERRLLLSGWKPATE